VRRATPPGAPEQEVFRSASEFYVAMTRAKSQLYAQQEGLKYWRDRLLEENAKNKTCSGLAPEFQTTVVEKNGEKQTIDLYRMTVTSIQGTVVLDLSSSNGAYFAFWAACRDQLMKELTGVRFILTRETIGYELAAYW